MNLNLDGIVPSSAVISDCRRYRYELWRRWSKDPHCVFIGLNPSTADETEDDPTIRKCVSYAKRWGYGGLCMLNLFAFRATQPKDMMAAEDPVGKENDQTLRAQAEGLGIIIAAWGRDGNYLGRDQQVRALFRNIHCLKHNKDGSPAHPLYLRGDLAPNPLR